MAEVRVRVTLHVAGAFGAPCTASLNPSQTPPPNFPIPSLSPKPSLYPLLLMSGPGFPGPALRNENQLASSILLP